MLTRATQIKLVVFAVIGILGKDEAVAFGLARRRMLEQLGIVVLHRAELRHQRGRKCVAPLIAEKAGKMLHTAAVGRQRMGLLIGDHLQAVLDFAKKAIRGTQLSAAHVIDPRTSG